ncbi:MAG: glycosyltransferase family 2 protein [Vicinamibacterales bacterium]
MLPFVSIVVPLLNEQGHVERLMRSLLEQDYPQDRYEILVADGGSTDATLSILKATDTSRRVRLFSNPDRTAPAALNALFRASRGDVIVRVDGHSWVAPDYLRRIVAVMEETGEAVVGGPVLMDPDTPFRRALAQALYASFAVGSVPYRTTRQRGYVPSLQTGAYRREVWAAVGPFDESLAVVEDVDYNTRVARAGYRLLIDPSIRFWYIPRDSPRALWQQIHGVGRIKVAVLAKHRDIVMPKYFVPSAFELALAASLAARVSGGAAGAAEAAGLIVPGAAAGARRAGVAGSVLPLGYSVLVLGFAASRLRAIGGAALWLLVIVPVLHVGYGTGFLAGLARLARRVQRPHMRTGVPSIEP